MGKIERGEGSVGKILTDERMADKLEEAVVGASDFVTGLTALETHVDVGSWYGFNRGIARTAFSLKLQPKPDKYYYLEIVDDSGALEKLTVSRTTPEGERVTVYEDDNEIRFTAMFAKRFFDLLVLRAGLIETSGGLGADLYFWDDRIELRSDLFNFGGPANEIAVGLFNARPRWRTLIKIQPVRHLYLTGGVDDVLNYDVDARTNGYGFDYFVGAGITFQDEDLRSILPFVPSF
jgi:phospholipid/cholesterol/gamma-HCH transport system substrate-binding protein